MRVYTGGTFDLPHSGHVNFLKKCHQMGDVIIALNTDEFITKYKGKPPIMKYRERESVLRAFYFVSDVVPNEFGADSKPTILKVNPDMIAIGTDWARKDYYKQMQFTQDWLDEHDIALCYIPYTRDVSTTNLKERMND